MYYQLTYTFRPGIQGLAGAFVPSIKGCYFNVMGFPIHQFTVHLADLIGSGTIRV